jgi:hypothetical protein
VAVRVALLALFQLATVRAYYGVTGMYLKLQAGFLEDGNPRFVFVNPGHLIAFDLLVIVCAIAHRQSAPARVTFGLGAPILATVAAGWVNTDPPVGRAFVAALVLAVLVLFGVFPLAPIRSSSDEDAS